MSNIDVLNKLKNETLNEYGSWAVYGDKAMAKADKWLDIERDVIGFPDLSDEELSKKIKPQYMLVGLNVSRDMSEKGKSWQNFHHTKNDGNILKIVSGSDYLGAYMTDILKDLPESKSGDVLRRVAGPNRDPEDVKTLRNSIKNFKKELDITKPEKIIFFGNGAFEIFKMAVIEKRLKVSDDIKVAKTLHYAYRFGVYINKEGNADRAKYSCFTGNDDDFMGSGQYKWNTIDEIKHMPT